MRSGCRQWRMGLQARDTAVIAEAVGVMMVIFAVPNFVVSWVEVALTLSEPELGAAVGAV